MHEDMPLTSILNSDNFFNSLLRSWKRLLPNLMHKHHIWEDEWKRQPICWNPLIKDDYGNMLGRRTRLNWVVVDETFAVNVGTWLNFNQSSRNVMELVLKSIRGGMLMFQEISNGYNRILPTSFNSNHVWYMAFSSFNVLIGARAYTSNESFLA